MLSGISIRRARDEDAAFVSSLAPSLLEFGSPAWQDAQTLVDGFRDVLAGAVRAQGTDAAVLIAEDADETRLGFISIKVKRDVADVERAHVADLAVIDGARSLGVGTRLMKAAESWAEERGLNVVSLDVWSTNAPALAFYQGIGYVPESLCLIKQLDRRSRES